MAAHPISLCVTLGSPKVKALTLHSTNFGNGEHQVSKQQQEDSMASTGGTPFLLLPVTGRASRPSSAVAIDDGSGKPPGDAGAAFVLESKGTSPILVDGFHQRLVR
jgi:hypothetical protein